MGNSIFGRHLGCVASGLDVPRRWTAAVIG